MMQWLKRLCKALLFPHIAVLLLLTPFVTALLVYSMVYKGTEYVISIISYVLSAYTLTVWCIKIPHLIRFFKSFKKENKYAQMWLNDEGLRVNVSLYGSLLFNVAYAIFQLGLGFFHSSFWFCSLAIYYICLAAMRFFLLRYTRKYKAQKDMITEFVRYRACAWVFLFLNLILSIIVFFMVYFNRTFVHSEITTIAMAAYTFTAFTVAIVNMVKYKQYNSPVYSASHSISFTAACVSILTLESTMLNTFGDEAQESFRQLMLALTGALISITLVLMGIYMIVKATKELKILRRNINNGTE
ncbi:MAG: hypothetical protein IJ039_03995 [Clostridia bacterium]|nr:hypothetical protein [Clostridia bacterium]